MDKTEVAKSLEALLEALEKTKMDISKEVREAMGKMDFGRSRAFSEMGEKVERLCKKVKEFKSEWQNISIESLNLKLFEKREKLKKGLKTKQEEYIIPILEVLIELGGSGKISEVLDRVYEKMKDKLNKYDLDPLPSDPKAIRWKNTAQWAKVEMVKKGLLSSKAPKGVWEITQRGRDYFEKKSNL